jgi:hypothetical protein
MVRKMATVKKLADVLPSEMREGLSKPFEDYLDKPLVIHTCRSVAGKNGEYMRMVVSLPGEDDQFYLSTGASQIMEVLKYLKENRSFPVEATFTKAGRAYLIK